jgi:D-alanyl-D-alanine carboxypeptidase
LSAAAVILVSVTAFAYRSDTGAALAAVQETQAAAAARAHASAYESVSIGANAAIVLDLSSGRALYEKNADTQLPLASLTKVPLVLSVIGVLPRESIITLPREVAPAGIAERLPVGSRWSVQSLIDYTLVASSNDGAEVLAQIADAPLRARYADAPDGKAAVWRMNDLVHGLGLAHTFFVDVSGLDVSTTLAGSYGSARNIARLFAYAASTSPDVFAKTADSRIVVHGLDGSATAENTNDALPSIPGFILGKTGYTDLAGGNLAVVYDEGPGHPVAIVVLGSTHEGRFDDMRVLVNATHAALSAD